MKKPDPIFVTRPALPPIEEFNVYLRDIWNSGILTNNGPYHQEFEKKLAAYLGIKYISLFSNGTLALVTAIQALKLSGEVITTPFSFVATTHALWWNNIKPVFCDIENKYFTLDPDRIESLITPYTTAILPVHVYGNPCQVERIQKIAETYGLKVIYDAAHAFGVKNKGRSILEFGDLSILSFHATKAFNTFEGGAIISPDEKTKKRIDFLKNFGFEDEVTVIEPGINAKMNELQAAFGLVQLNHIDDYTSKRKQLVSRYRDQLKNINGIKYIDDIEDVTHSYTYFPVLVDKKSYGKSRDELYTLLKSSNIFCRRYFYPLISKFPTYKGLISSREENLPVASQIAERVICLPLYSDLRFEQVDFICKTIKNYSK